ncbi:protein kinase domain-containing protein [Vibrio lentus]|uniref:protein kinase domain-containing protein n=1 Tax=Vibrio lentus TaxID=136468 RepID=UPI0010BD41A7|nr:protein kinase [Vibrio lentus]TKF40448.1 protein kinase family protein [Vibrio lentus]
MSLLEKLGLLEIEGYSFVRLLGGGSALSSLYQKQKDFVVFKFLVAPRNKIERDRFYLEHSILSKNWTIGFSGRNDFRSEKREQQYPLPIITHPIKSLLDDKVVYFGYKYEKGQLLSDWQKEEHTLKEKLYILYRVASALCYFNVQGYTHKDLHPSNILLLDNPDMETSPDDPCPQVKILDMGSCFRSTDPIIRNENDINQVALELDDSRRLLSSFQCMPPDFLVNGSSATNYDSWAFGLMAYNIIFEEMPFEVKTINDVYSLLHNEFDKSSFEANVNKLDLGLSTTLKRLLSVRGEERLPHQNIVNMFSWILSDDPRFNEAEFIEEVIKNHGHDPHYDARDNYY